MAQKRKYPIGIQSFESLRKDGYLYIDKTPLIYKMITEGKSYFLSRPRRFGKSLLTTTLQAIFEGKRDLFEEFTTADGVHQPALFIAGTDWRWEVHPVLRFDFSGDLKSIGELDKLINDILSDFEQKYGLSSKEPEPVLRFPKIVKAAHEQTGQRVVVIVDEYDKLMLHSIGNPEEAEAVRIRFKGLFSPLKNLDEHLQFVFITGISKFSQMGVFSSLNQLKNISMLSSYETICGISEQELTTAMQPDIEWLAEERGLDYNQQLSELKERYDGYHFSSRLTDMYNPFSLLNAIDGAELRDYWFESATPSALISLLSQMPPLELTELEPVRCPATSFDRPIESFDNPLPVLFQSGYLTITGYQPDREMFTLGFPNKEVRRGFADNLYQYVTAVKGFDRGRSAFLDAYYDFRDSADLSSFIAALQTFFAGLPYYLEQNNKNEAHYHSILYTLLTAFGANIRCEEPSAQGRADLTLLMPKGIYIMELKCERLQDHQPADGTAVAANALQQIRDRGYADKYRLDGRSITLVGLCFSSETRNITNWQSQPL
ncbi:MAG: ATP-binding protein [Bacteroidaceae bacterium]|nr:ATP-binding protein [Bacteroidaceae bacterium]